MREGLQKLGVGTEFIGIGRYINKSNKRLVVVNIYNFKTGEYLSDHNCVERFSGMSKSYKGCYVIFKGVVNKYSHKYKSDCSFGVKIVSLVCFIVPLKIRSRNRLVWLDSRNGLNNLYYSGFGSKVCNIDFNNYFNSYSCDELVSDYKLVFADFNTGLRHFYYSKKDSYLSCYDSLRDAKNAIRAELFSDDYVIYS